MSFQGDYAGNGSAIPTPTWNGPLDWPHPRNLIRLDDTFHSASRFAYLGEETVPGPDDLPSIRIHKLQDNNTAQQRNSPFAWVTQSLVVPTTDQYSTSIEVRSSQSLAAGVRVDNRFDGAFNNSTTTGYPTANEWVTVIDEGTDGTDASNHPGDDTLFVIVAVAGGLSIDLGETFDYGAVQVLRNPGTPGWTIADVPYRPHPLDWYAPGQFWNCTGSGSIAGQPFEPGDQIYATGPGDAPYLFADEVTFVVVKPVTLPADYAPVPPPDYEWSVRSPSGAEAALDQVTGRSLTFRVDGAADARASLSGRSVAAGLIRKYESDLLVRRNGELIYRGKVIADPSSLSPARHDMLIASVDYRGLLDVGATVGPTGAVFAGVDQGQIAWDLIDAYQGRPGGARGITEGLGSTSGTTRDRTYDPGAPIGKLIGDLGRVENGFEWEISPLLELNRWYPRRGQLRGALEWGSDIIAASESGSTRFVNSWVGTGAPETTPIEVTSADVAVDPRGRWESSVGYSSVKEQATLADKLAWLLDESSSIRPEWGLTMRRGWWLGPSVFEMGDTFPLVIDDGVVEIDATYRAVEMSIALGLSDADEVVRLGVIAA